MHLYLKNKVAIQNETEWGYCSHKAESNISQREINNIIKTSFAYYIRPSVKDTTIVSSLFLIFYVKPEIKWKLFDNRKMLGIQGNLCVVDLSISLMVTILRLGL